MLRGFSKKWIIVTSWETFFHFAPKQRLQQGLKIEKKVNRFYWKIITKRDTAQKNITPLKN